MLAAALAFIVILFYCCFKIVVMFNGFLDYSVICFNSNLTGGFFVLPVFVVVNWSPRGEGAGRAG